MMMMIIIIITNSDEFRAGQRRFSKINERVRQRTAKTVFDLNL